MRSFPVQSIDKRPQATTRFTAYAASENNCRRATFSLNQPVYKRLLTSGQAKRHQSLHSYTHRKQHPRQVQLWKPSPPTPRNKFESPLRNPSPLFYSSYKQPRDTLPLPQSQQPPNLSNNVRTRSRIDSYQRRPAQQAPRQAPCRDTAFRTRHTDRISLPGSLKRDQTSGCLQAANLVIVTSPAGDCRKRSGVLGWCGVGRVPCLQGESEEGVRASATDAERGR